MVSDSLKSLKNANKRVFKNVIKKQDNRKEVSVSFQTALNKIEEVDETRSRSSEERKARIDFLGKKYDMESPKSASSAVGVSLRKKSLKKRPRSWEPTRRKDRLGRSSLFKKPFHVRECCNSRCHCVSLLDFDSGSSSCCEDEHGDGWTISRCSCLTRRKPKYSKAGYEKCENIFTSEIELQKMKRSLRLLGFELSDFGIYSSGGETTPRRRPRQKSPTFRTKITDRSVSLDSLRQSVKQAWANDRLGESHRRLLAQAAYEEWYFRKEGEFWKKREEERIRRTKAIGSLREDIQKKKEKSEEEFRKWLQRKKTKRKEKKGNFKGKQEGNPFAVKSKEEIEEAFTKWKKTKDELEKRKRKKKKEEEEKKIASERQKAEKKITAEKAFQQWKIKLEESEKLEEEKRQKKRKRQEETEKRRKEERGSQISFQIWKEAKDQQIKQRIKQVREAEKMAREERVAQMEERMYEAEQAFEDWLEKVDSRRYNQFCSGNHQKVVPWIPA